MRNIVKIATATAFSVAFAIPVAAQDLVISEIAVDADFEAANANALDFYPELSADLQAKLIEVLAPQLGESPFRVQVNIHEVSLDGDTFLPDDGEFNTLDGTINVFQRGEVTPDEKFLVELSAYTGDGVAPEGAFILPPDREDFYQALIDAFALNAKAKLMDVDTTGETIDSER